MEGLLVFGLITAGLALLDGLASAIGVDSRPDFIDPREPARPTV
jgi:hypothetical protein